MQVKASNNHSTEKKLYVIATSSELETLKQQVLSQMSGNVKVPGFREGKVPPAVLEKNIDPQKLQPAFLEEAINQLYPQAVRSEKIRPVDNPKIDVKKFVPFTSLEFEAVIPVLGTVKLADYKKVKLKPKSVNVTEKDVDEVIKSLRTRLATKTDVSRAAKPGDQIWIDFSGKDKAGKAVPGADGKDYPILLGSDTFIPGFEDNLVGAKTGDTKEFTVKFPKDYRAKQLAGSPVTFVVKVKKVQEVTEPELNDEFAAQAGPVKNLKELKADIKRQLEMENSRKASMDFQTELIRQITAKSNVEIPEALINNQIERLMRDLEQNLAQRGQTLEDYLAGLGQTEEEYKNSELKQHAAERVRASIVLAEIAEAEKLTVTPAEIDEKLRTLREQYSDPQMRAELDKPQARGEIASRLLTDKTVAKLVEYSTS